MHVAWRLLGSVLLYTSAVVCKTCLVYSYGSYTKKECDSCCDAGIRRRCCTEAPVKITSTSSEVGIVFGCLLGMLFLAGVFGTVVKCCQRWRRAWSSRASFTGQSPSVSSLTCVTSTGLNGSYPKPPAYSAWTPPPPYCILQDDETLPDSLHINVDIVSTPPCRGPANSVSREDENIPPPPYTPRSDPSQINAPCEKKQETDNCNEKCENTVRTV